VWVLPVTRAGLYCFRGPQSSDNGAEKLPDARGKCHRQRAPECHSACGAQNVGPPSSSWRKMPLLMVVVSPDGRWCSRKSQAHRARGRSGHVAAASLGFLALLGAIGGRAGGLKVLRRRAHFESYAISEERS
jgi:hypothetical protein